MLGLSDELPSQSNHQEQFVPYIPTAVDPTIHVQSQIAEPLPVNDFGNPAPALDPQQHTAAAAQQPHTQAAQPPIPDHRTVASAELPTVPASSANVPYQGMSEPAAAAAAPAPGYMEAINAALRGATPGGKPVLDSANPGPEGYMGAKVHGSVGSTSTPRDARRASRSSFVISC